jgi:hypothetical protein
MHAANKAVFDRGDNTAQQYSDRLTEIRHELRNFTANGALRKQGEAYRFHSGAGAVPVFLPHRAGSRKYRLGAGIAFRGENTLALIDTFIAYLWSGGREPAGAGREEPTGARSRKHMLEHAQVSALPRHPQPQLHPPQYCLKQQASR